MSVDDWARQEAKRLVEVSEPSVRNGVCLVCGGAVLNAGEHIDPERHEAGRVEQGIVHAFSALLSDEAVEAVRAELHYRLRTDHGHTTRQEAQVCKTCLRRAEVLAPIAVQAAIDAVAKEARND